MKLQEIVEVETKIRESQQENETLVKMNKVKKSRLIQENDGEILATRKKISE